jgi:hypothetical protein
MIAYLFCMIAITCEIYPGLLVKGKQATTEKQ